MNLEWGDGSYEHTARDLEPAAERILDVADITPNEHVLDLGCGTGNAALAAARRGAKVTAVDPSARLLETARSRAYAEGLQLVCSLGEGAAIDIADHSFTPSWQCSPSSSPPTPWPP